MKKRISITYNAPVTLTFTIVCAIVLALDNFLVKGLIRNYFTCYKGSFASPLTYLRLVSYIFGHSNWSHFASNMSFILLLGPMIEEKYGSDRTMIMILLTALVGGLLNVFLFPHTGLVGASGICFMFIVLSSVTSVKKGEIPLTLIMILVVYLGKEVGNMFAINNVSELTHIAGGICGAIFGMSRSN